MLLVMGKFSNFICIVFHHIVRNFYLLISPSEKVNYLNCLLEHSVIVFKVVPAGLQGYALGLCFPSASECMS